MFFKGNPSFLLYERGPYSHIEIGQDSVLNTAVCTFQGHASSHPDVFVKWKAIRWHLLAFRVLWDDWNESRAAFGVKLLAVKMVQNAEG